MTSNAPLVIAYPLSGQERRLPMTLHFTSIPTVHMGRPVTCYELDGFPMSLECYCRARKHC